MLETIFEWMSGAVAEGLEFIVNIVLRMLQLDISLVTVNFPIMATVFTVFRAMGVGIAVAIGIFSISKFSFGSLADTRDTPQQILFRVAISIFLIYFGTYALEWIINIAKIPYDVILNQDAASFKLAGSADIIESAGKLASANAGAWLLGGPIAGGIIGLGTASTLLLYLILLLIIAYNVCKLLIETFQRFVWLCVLLVASPLAFATYSSKNTSQILSKFINMFLSQCLLMIMSVWMLKAICSGFTFTDAEAAQQVETGVFMRYMLTLAMCKVGMTMDKEIQKLALNSATTTGNILDEAARDFMMFMRPITKRHGSSIAGAAGKAILDAQESHSKHVEQQKDNPKADTMRQMGATMGADGSVSVKGTSGYDLKKKESKEGDYMTATKASVLGASMMNTAADADFSRGKGARFAQNTIDNAPQSAAQCALFDDNLSHDMKKGTNDAAGTMLVGKALGKENPINMRPYDPSDQSTLLQNFSSKSVGNGGRLTDFDFTNKNGEVMHGQLANKAYVDSLSANERKNWKEVTPSSKDLGGSPLPQGYYKVSKSLEQQSVAQSRVFSGSYEKSTPQGVQVDKEDISRAFGNSIPNMDKSSISAATVRSVVNPDGSSVNQVNFKYRDSETGKIMQATVSDSEIRNRDGVKLNEQSYVRSHRDSQGNEVGGFYFSTIPATATATTTKSDTREYTGTRPGTTPGSTVNNFNADQRGSSSSVVHEQTSFGRNQSQMGYDGTGTVSRQHTSDPRPDIPSQSNFNYNPPANSTSVTNEKNYSGNYSGQNEYNGSSYNEPGNASRENFTPDTTARRSSNPPYDGGYNASYNGNYNTGNDSGSKSGATPTNYSGNQTPQASGEYDDNGRRTTFTMGRLHHGSDFPASNDPINQPRSIQTVSENSRYSTLSQPPKKQPMGDNTSSSPKAKDRNNKKGPKHLSD